MDDQRHHTGKGAARQGPHVTGGDALPKRIKPLANPQYTQVPNFALDHIMPHVSANAWRVLCVIIRATWGWTDEGSPTKRREDWLLSYSEIKRRSGIRSDGTVSGAIKSLLNYGCISRRRAPQPADAGAREPSFLYSLNRDFEVEVATTETGATTRNGVAATTKNGVAATTKNGEIQTNPQRKQTEKESTCAAAPQTNPSDSSETGKDDGWKYTGPAPRTPAWYEEQHRRSEAGKSRRRSRPRQRQAADAVAETP